MQFGLYAPVPHVTVGSKAIEQSVAGALKPLPPAKVEYVEKQPSLEDVFFAVVGDPSEDDRDSDAGKGSQDRKTRSDKK